MLAHGDKLALAVVGHEGLVQEGCLVLGWRLDLFECVLQIAAIVLHLVTGRAFVSFSEEFGHLFPVVRLIGKCTILTRWISAAKVHIAHVLT